MEPGNAGGGKGPQLKGNARSDEDEPPAEQSGRARRGLRVASLARLAICAIVAVLLGLKVGGWRGQTFALHVNPHVQALAVLPLGNLSADPEQEYSADGIADFHQLAIGTKSE